MNSYIAFSHLAKMPLGWKNASMANLYLRLTLKYVLEVNLVLLIYKHNSAFFHNGFVYLQCNLLLDQLALE